MSTINDFLKSHERNAHLIQNEVFNKFDLLLKDISNQCFNTFLQNDNDDNKFCYQRLQIHETFQPHPCKYCNKRFQTPSTLRIHERTHTKDKPFECHQCKKLFASQTIVTNHINQIHTNNRTYPCKYCNKRFTRRSTLRIHERTHTKDKPFECDQCKKLFASQTIVTNHINQIHTNNRTYPCKYCNKRFTISSQCIIHERTMHAVNKPYSCNNCDKQFTSSCTRNTHQKKYCKASTKIFY